MYHEHINKLDLHCLAMSLDCRGSEILRRRVASRTVQLWITVLVMTVYWCK